MADTKLSNKIALITGASKGLGRTMAIALAQEGVKVVLLSRDQNKLEGVATEVRAAGSEAFVFTGDVSREEDVLRAEREISASVGKIDILINNAGINIRKNITDFTLEEWNRVHDTNLTSVFLMCRSFVPHMKGKGYGRILNMTSIMSHVSLGQRSAYSSSKTALLGLTRALAMELALEAITVNGISPGPIGTEMNHAIMNDPVANAQFLAKLPLGRWGKEEEIGQLAVYLCSEAAGFITGTDILIDGGWCAQ